MKNILATATGKAVIGFSSKTNMGSGSTWPGHIALKLNKNFISEVLNKSKTKVVIVAGTNGKTTTGRLITSIVRENGKTYLQNKAGANLLNGLASAIVKGSSLNSKLSQDYLVFECDEYALPLVLKQVRADYVICLNLFRDQLDRYGEIDSIAKKWKKAFDKLNKSTTLILNADDPEISYLGEKSKAKVLYFGLDETSELNSLKHGADSIHCPKCGYKLLYKTVYFSHLGDWKCPNCGLGRPKLDISNLGFHPLVGTYNKYNTLAAYLFGKAEKISDARIKSAFKTFTPAFGRQEELIYKGKKVQLFLSKNPTSFNESMHTITTLGGKNFLILLNDRIPDGLDVSWIWDIGFERILPGESNIAVSGDRVYDIALRLKYAGFFTHVDENPESILNKMVDQLTENETLYILPNYSAMLDIRKVITGKKLL
jgi:UDP-N-acetylmuramyl tripeptide synthase